MTQNQDKKQSERGHKRLALSCAGLVLVMVGMAYAAVPLYQIFCQVTGYGGTTQKAEKASGKVLSKVITIRFDANKANGLAWNFDPVQRKMRVKIGETNLAFYRAKNVTDQAITATATFNVTPEEAGSYFNKVECFCFTEQTLKPGQEMDMPVSFYIDPEIVKDDQAKEIREITLSYTFFPEKKEAVAELKDASRKEM